MLKKAGDLIMTNENAIEKAFMVIFLFLLVIYSIQYAITGTDAGSTLFQNIAPVLVGLAATIGIALLVIRYVMKK